MQKIILDKSYHVKLSNIFDNIIKLSPMLTDLASYYKKQQYRPNQLGANLSSLLTLSRLAARTYQIHGQGLNLYVTILGQTGYGKSEYSTLFHKMLNEIDIDSVQDIFDKTSASGQAIQQSLCKKPLLTLYIDEFSYFLKMLAMSNPPSYKVEEMRMLLNLFNLSGNGNVLPMKIYAKSDDDQGSVYAPAVSLITLTTPEHFYDHMNKEMLEHGFLSRMLIFDLNNDVLPKPRSDFSEVILDSHLKSKLSNVASIAKLNCTTNNFIDVRFDGEEARQQYLSIQEEFELDIKSNDISAMLYQRAALQALKIASLIAVSVDHETPKITSQMLIQSWALVELLLDNIKTKFQSGEQGESSSDNETVMLDVITKLAEKNLAGNWVLLRDVKNYAKRRRPFTKMQEKRSWMMDNTIKSLCREGHIRLLSQQSMFDLGIKGIGTCYWLEDKEIMEGE